MAIINQDTIAKHLHKRQNKMQHYNFAKKAKFTIIYWSVYLCCHFVCSVVETHPNHYLNHCKVGIQLHRLLNCSMGMRLIYLLMATENVAKWTIRRRNDTGMCFSDHFLHIQGYYEPTTIKGKPETIIL